MSLKKYELEETAVLHLKDAHGEPMYATGPDGEPDTAKPMRGTFYGPGSRQYAAAQAQAQAAMLERMQKGGKKDSGGLQAVREKADFLAQCTKELENVASESGATGQALCLEIYGNLKLSFWTRQIEAFITADQNFTQGSRPN